MYCLAVGNLDVGAGGTLSQVHVTCSDGVEVKERAWAVGEVLMSTPLQGSRGQQARANSL